MTRTAAGLLLVTLVGATQGEPDAGRVLAGIRQALGGDAAIAAVHAFSAGGTESRNLGGHTSSADVEWVCQLPDRFIRTRRLGSPGGIVVETDGFNGDAHIQRRDSDMPYPPDPFQNDTPDQRAEREKARVRNLKHEFARTAIAMIGIPAIDPSTVSIDAPQTVDGKRLDVLVLKSADAYEARVFVDSASHLPFAVAWIAAPIVSFSSSAIVRVPRGQSPPAVLPPPDVPPGDPTAGLPKVLHQIRFEDFRLEDNLNWPHRFVEKVGDQVWTTTKIGKYKINPRIDPKKFAGK